MVRKLTANFIYKDALIDKLSTINGYESKSLKKLGKNELCWLALDHELITHVQCSESLDKRTSTIPCYLFTQIKDQDIRNYLEEYVINYSLLYARGSFIANLATIKNLPIQYPIEFPLEEFCQIPSFLLKEDDLKKCFYPERWINKDLLIDNLIKDIVVDYKHLLEPYLPRLYNDKVLLADTGWDNALNHMGSSYMGHIKVQILTHLPRRIVDYIIEHHCSQGTDPKSLKYISFGSIVPTTGVHNDDIEFVMKIRSSLGLSFKDRLDECFKDINNYNWSVHLWLQRFNNDVNKSTSILPVVKLNRKYAYLDTKIVESLIPFKIKKRMKDMTINHKGSDLQKILGITSTLFNKEKAKIRRKLRNKKTNKYKKYNDKKSNKYRRHGRGSLPTSSKIVTISTDGVGLRFCCEFTPKKPNNGDIKDELFPRDCLKKGVDNGRVRIITSVDSDNKVFMMKRKDFYFAQKDFEFKKWEKEMMTNTPWGQALANLSQAGGFKNQNLQTWIDTLTVQKDNINIILQEQLIDKERSKKRMVRFRGKKSWIDRRVREWLYTTYKNKRHTIMGIGDGEFPCTGKGEMAVPTTGFQVALKKAIKMLKIQRLVKIVKIDEYMTTQCCHKCLQKMSTIKTCHGKDCQRYRLCTECCTKTTGKRRHRDVNAARNILYLLNLQIRGYLRPDIMICPWKKNVALPPIVRTANDLL